MAQLKIHSGIVVGEDGICSRLILMGKVPHVIWESAREPLALGEAHSHPLVPVRARETQNQRLLDNAEATLSAGLAKLLSPWDGE